MESAPTIAWNERPRSPEYAAIPVPWFGAAPGTAAVESGQVAYASLGVGTDGGSLAMSGTGFRGVWATALYGYSDLAGTATSPGAESGTGGFLIGADLFTGPTYRVGAAAGLSWTDLDGDASGDSADADGAHLLFYGDWKNDGWFASGVGQLAFFDQSIVRSNISGAQGTAATRVGRSSASSTAAELCRATRQTDPRPT
jgi:outer membrane autotransporter protein